MIPTSGLHAAGSTVSISAIPDPGYRFTGWTGDLSGVEISQTLIIDGPRSVTANFIRTYTLLTNAGVGGTITPASGSVYDENSTVDVEAIPDPGYRFAGWSGALAGNQAATTLTMDGDKTIDASFVRTYTLTTNAGIGGSITPNSGSFHDENSTVDVEAIPDPGYRFSGWSGALTGNQNPAALTMNSDMQVDASFELIIPVLASRISGNEVILSWPILSPSWTLQWSPALDQESWKSLNGPYQSNGVENSWQEPASHDRRFFRLMHP